MLKSMVMRIDRLKTLLLAFLFSITDKNDIRVNFVQYNG